MAGAGNSRLELQYRSLVSGAKSLLPLLAVVEPHSSVFAIFVPDASAIRLVPMRVDPWHQERTPRCGNSLHDLGIVWEPSP